MGLGKTAQAILSMRPAHQGHPPRSSSARSHGPQLGPRTPHVGAADIPFETIDGDPDRRRTAWLASNCPLKLVNYETLTRDADLAGDERVGSTWSCWMKPQRIKNKDSKAAHAARAISREQSWALTGTPIENHLDDLVNIFAFVDPDRIPPRLPPKRLPVYTSDCILRRTKDVVRSDMPPKTVRDLEVELTPACWAAYAMAEDEDRPPQRTRRHHHRPARLPAGAAVEADLQLRSAYRREREARTVARGHGGGRRQRPQGDRL